MLPQQPWLPVFSGSWPPVLTWAELPLQQRLIGVLGAKACIALYLHFLVYKARVGLPRFLLAIPPLLALAAFPTLFDPVKEVLLRCSLLFTCSWLGTKKVLAMCINRGSLAAPMTLSQFSALLYLPIFPNSGEQSSAPKGRLHDSAGGPARLLLQAFAKIGLLGFVVYLILQVPLPPFWKHLCFAFGLVGFLGIIMDGPASIATSFIGLRIIPTFDKPWLSSSMADFWGRRWNITTSSVLRVLFYDPLVEGCLVKPQAPAPTSTPLETPEISRSSSTVAATPSPKAPTQGVKETLQGLQSTEAAPAPVRPVHHTAKWRRVAGTCATFLASGLAHEFIINMLLAPLPDGSRPWMWKWTAYFTLQAPLLIGEMKLKKMWRKAGLRQPNIWLARVVTIWFLLTVAGPLFFAPVDRDSELAMRVTDAVKEGFLGIAAAVRPLLDAVSAGMPAAVRSGLVGVSSSTEL